MLVLNVLECFQNKKENNRGNISVIKCAASKVSERTIKRIRQQGLTGNNQFHTKRRKDPKTKDVCETEKYEIRGVIYNIIEENQHVTLEKLRQELINRQIINVSTSSLRNIVKILGFKYAVDCERRALMENPEIVSKRVQFLRNYVENTSLDDPLDAAFIDEVFQRGSNIRTWHDTNPNSVLNKKGSEGSIC